MSVFSQHALSLPDPRSPSRALGPWAGVPDLQHLQDEEDGADEAAFRIYAFVKDLKS